MAEWTYQEELAALHIRFQMMRLSSATRKSTDAIGMRIQNFKSLMQGGGGLDRVSMQTRRVFRGQLMAWRQAAC